MIATAGIGIARHRTARNQHGGCPLSDRDRETRVELVSRSGTTIGSAGKLVVHQPPGRLHRAASVLLLDSAGRLIIQRRAAGKYHAAGCWSNTACGHPEPGESPVDLARRRLREELGIAAATLDPAGTTTYRVRDGRSGLIEHEYNHLFVGTTIDPPDPRPAEVEEVAAIDLETARGVGSVDAAYAPWFAHVVAPAWQHLLRVREGQLDDPSAAPIDDPPADRG